jgi:hypothetical protein
MSVEWPYLSIDTSGVMPLGKNDQAMPSMEPYRMRVDDVLTALGGDARRGLSADEARLRLERYGMNEWPRRGRRPLGRNSSRSSPILS